MKSLLAFALSHYGNIKSIGDEKLSSIKNTLIATDNLTYAEAFHLQSQCSRPLQFIICASPDSLSAFATRHNSFDLHFISSSSKQPLIDLIASAFHKRKVVCLLKLGLPHHTLCEVLRKTHATLVPFRALQLDKLWLNRTFQPLEWRGLPKETGFFYARPIPPADLTLDFLNKSFLDLSAQTLEAHPFLKQHLGVACIEGLKQKQFKSVIIDTFQEGKSLSGGMLLSVSWALSEWLSSHVPDKRIGLVLPPGLGATIANLACVLCNKTPVNLNFTMGASANVSAIETADLKTIITANSLVKKLPDFPWTSQRLDLSQILKKINKFSLLFKRAKIFFFSASKLRELIGTPTKGGLEEAGLLFTSGSSGSPKGVVLSHRNILSNTAQVRAVLPNRCIPSIMGCLPIFHSFGFTVTLWWPLISGPQAITYISPLDVTKVIEAIEQYGISLLVTTPTFLRTYTKKAKPHQLKSLQMVVTGAEKLPRATMEDFETKFSVPICEGYGMTETTPVISVNLIDEIMVQTQTYKAIPRKPGTVGQPMPGVSIRVRHPDTEQDLELHESGMLWFRGGNVFGGYLNEPQKTEAVLKDGWYLSGDIGRIDEDGFLVIEGRRTRFSKIGGEMVPHGTIEQHLLEALRESPDDDLMIVVMGVEDEAKGEALVVLTTRDIPKKQIDQVLTERGLPNLWKPKYIKRIDQPPLLASGKLDLQACKKLVDDLIS